MQQVEQLRNSDNLQKLRQQYDSAMESLQRKHQDDMLQIKVELDASHETIQSQVSICVYMCSARMVCYMCKHVVCTLVQ